MASAEEITVPVRVLVTIDGDPRPEAESFLRAAADAAREVKRMRQDVRHLDRKLARLMEATHALFGIDYTKETASER